MHIDEIIQSLANSENNSVIIPDNWAQGRTVYGGITAALVYQRMQQMVHEDRFLYRFFQDQ